MQKYDSKNSTFFTWLESTFFLHDLQEFNLLINMTQRVSWFFEKCSKELELFVIWLKRIEPFFSQYVSKNWTFFSTWLIEIEPFFSTSLKELIHLVQNDSKNWTGFSKFDSKNWTSLKNIWLEELNLSMTRGIELFSFNLNRRIEPFFYNITQIIDFLTCLTELYPFFNMTHRIEPFFSTWLKENDTIFWAMTQRVNWSFLQNVTHRIEPSSCFQRTSMTPRIEFFFLNQKIKELNPFLLDVTQRIVFSFWKNNDSKDLI